MIDDENKCSRNNKKNTDAEKYVQVLACMYIRENRIYNICPANIEMKLTTTCV